MASIEVTVRPATPDDASCLSALATQVFLDTYATSGIRLALAREAQSHFAPSAFEALLAKSDCSVLLVEHANHLIAFAEIVQGASHRLVQSGSAAELARLYVQSPFQRQGVGQLLLGRCEALAQSMGACTLWLTAWVGNQPALAFYVNQGYRQLGSTPYVFEDEAFENWLFAKSLVPGS